MKALKPCALSTSAIRGESSWNETLLQSWAVWNISRVGLNYCGLTGTGLDHSWVHSGPCHWIMRALFVHFWEVESFGGSLGYLDSKTSLSILLRVMIAARMHLERGEKLSLRVCIIVNALGSLRLPKEWPLNMLLYWTVSMDTWKTTNLVFIKLLIISWWLS